MGMRLGIRKARVTLHHHRMFRQHVMGTFLKDFLILYRYIKVDFSGYSAPM